MIGLTQAQAKARLSIYGLNKITKKRTFSGLKIFFSQFLNFLIIILIFAGLAAFLAGKTIEALAIFFIIILNVFLGFFMELRAEKSISALKQMLVPRARVIRDGKEQFIETQFLVPGDIIILEEGSKIPADAKIIEAVSLEVNEAVLTGESLPVVKAKQDTVFMGTIITKGYGRAEVNKTGLQTEFGKIAGMLVQVKEPSSPLQKQIVILGKRIALIAFIIAAFILVFGIVKGMPVYEYLMIGLSLFVAVIPEGLLVVMTLALALGVHRMAKKKAIIRKLASVETLGCAQVIATDKTGTLTKNEMAVKKIWVAGKEFEVGEKKFDSKLSLEIPVFLRIGVLCNTAEVYSKKNGGFEILGEPTEASLLVLGEKAGFKEREVKAQGRFIKEFPFDQVLKRRTVVWEEKSGSVEVLSVGGPESILEISSKFLKGVKELELSSEVRQEINQVFQALAGQGYRMLGLAYKKFFQTSGQTREQIEKDMVFTGLAAIYDAPRPEAAQAVKNCQQAGIRVIMITGDNELTALAIAKEVGLVYPASGPASGGANEKAVVGKQLDQMNEKEFFRTVDKINIFARTTPLHKLKIIKALQRNGNIVAVTGDGVNDAPALKEADIGAAMGIVGTDVAREASDMIITDDNFASIVGAVKQGRTIFDNIKKFIQFLLTANAIETPLIVGALLLGWPLPIGPLHILWINLVTDSLPAVTLSIEPSHSEIMKRKPRSPKETVFKGIVSFIMTGGFLGFLGGLTIFSWVYFKETGQTDLILARTMVFTFIVMFKLFLVFSCRSFKESILKLGLFTNKKMILAVGFSLLLQLLVIYHPMFQRFFGTTNLGFYDWLIILPLALSGFILMEVKKQWRK